MIECSNGNWVNPRYVVSIRQHPDHVGIVTSLEQIHKTEWTLEKVIKAVDDANVIVQQLQVNKEPTWTEVDTDEK